MQRKRRDLRLAARVAAAGSFGWTVGTLVLGAVLDVRFRAAGRSELQQLADAGFLAAWLASAVVGAVLLLRRPAHPVGWLFTALATAIGTWGLSDSYGLYGVVVRPGLSGAAAAAVLANSLFIVVFALLALVCSLTPDGRHLSNRWRQLRWIVVCAVPVPALMALAFVSDLVDNEVLLNLATAALMVLVPVGAGLAVTRSAETV